MKQCPKCKEWIAKAATKCPRCQSAQPQPVWAVILGTVLVVLIGAWAFGSCDGDRISEAPQESNSDDHRPAWEKYGLDRTKQKERSELIADLTARGIIRRIEPGSVNPRVIVGPEFETLDVEAKSTFARLIFAYYVCGPSPECDLVVFKHFATGKKLGSWSPDFGLDWR